MSHRYTNQLSRGGTEKQAAQSWGAQEGNAEQKDEQAGEEMAQKEFKDAAAEDAEAGETAEPENKSISYEDYLTQQAEKKLALADGLEIRKANEGSKADKKWANTKPLEKEEDEDFIAGTGGKSKRERERKTKNVLDIDQSWVEAERSSAPRGGRGGARGDGGRGGRGRGEGRGRGAPRGGDFPRGGRGGRGGSAFNANDQSAFPSLGA